MNHPPPQDDLKIVVGEDKRLTDLLADEEVGSLLRSVVQAGMDRARIVDEFGQILWTQGETDSPRQEEISLPLKVEGETVGRVVLIGDRDQKIVIQSLANVLRDIVNTMLHNNLKRLLTTEIHTSVVQQSYEELLDANRKLSLSEARYRELAKTLEKKVEERTKDLKRAHTAMLQQEKLAAVGQLAAGVAHEINNPLGFVYSNFNAIARYLERIKIMLAALQAAFGNKEPAASVMAELEEKWRDLRLSIIVEDLGDLIVQSSEGCERIKKIVSDLKGFSHIDDAEIKLVDVSREIDRTLSVLGHQLPADAVIEKKYQKIPDVLCNPALLCQVFFNIIHNACLAMPAGLRLLIETRAEGGNIIIRIKDNGPGIPMDMQSRIFEPFFTTREVGKGSGMGLAMSHDVIASYNGTLTVQSEPGQGASFIITLPGKEK